MVVAAPTDGIWHEFSGRAAVLTNPPQIHRLPKIDSVLDLRTPSWAPGARFVLTVVAPALFGLLSMHGWGSHTGTHTMAMAPATSAISTYSSQATGHSHVTMKVDVSKGAGAQASEGAAATSGQEKPDGDPGAGLLGLCLAVLCALLLAIALLLARHAIAIPRWLLPTWTQPVFIGRDRDPPDLLRLCVIRC